MKAYDDDRRVAAVLADLDSAPIAEPLRATLRLLAKVTTHHDDVGPDDVRAVLAAGVTRAQIEDALAVAWSFNVINRLGDAFGFAIPPDDAFQVAAKMLLSRGYKL